MQCNKTRKLTLVALLRRKLFLWYKYINMQHNTLYNIRPIEKSRNTLMYVTRYVWEMGGALVSVVVATPVNRLPTRTICYFEPECIQFF